MSTSTPIPSRRFQIVLLFLFMLSTGSMELAAQRSQEYGFPAIRNYSPKEYQGSTQNWDILEDKRGVLYVGNNGGVLEYDGARWRLIPLKNNTTCRSLAIDQEGRIYAGGVGDLGRLEPDSKGSLHYVSMEKDLPVAERNFLDVWHAHTYRDGILFMTDDRFFYWQPREKKFKIWKAQTSFHVSFIVNDELYVRQRGLGLYKMEKDSLVLLPGGEQFAEERPYVMLPFPGEAGKILLGVRSRGLFVFDGQKFSPFATEADGFLKENNLYLPGLILKDGRILLNTFDRGAVILDRKGRLLQKLDQTSGLLTSAVQFAYEDHSGALWLGLSHGLSRIEVAAPFTFFDGRSKLIDYPNSIIRHQGRLYAGTNTGVYCLDPPTQTFQLIPGARNQSFSFTVASGQLLVTTNDGIQRIEGKQATTVIPSGKIRFNGNFLFKSKIDSNRVFVNLLEGIASIYLQNGKWINEGLLPGISDQTFGVVEESDGNLWTGSYSGGEVLHIVFPKTSDGKPDYHRPRVQRFGTDKGLPLGLSDVASLNGEIYVLSFNGGVYLFREKDQKFIPEKTLNVLDVVYGSETGILKKDSRGKIWLCRGKEIAIGTPQADGSIQWDKNTLAQFKDEIVSTIYPEADGTVWIGGIMGAIRYDTRRQAGSSRASFQTLIRRVSLNNEQDTLYGGHGILNGKIIRLDPTQNTLRFEYATLSFAAPESNQYRTWLEGLEKSWGPWNHDNSKEYVNLPPGTYHFHVIGKNVFGQESKEAVYSFHIRVPWYQSIFAWLVYILAGLVLVYGLVRWRTQQLKARSLRLEAAVQERTIELSQRTEELSQRVEELATVNQVSSSLVSQLHLDELFQLVGDEMRRLFKANIVYIAVHDKATDMIHFPYEYGDSTPSRKFGNGLTEKIIRTRQPILENRDSQERKKALQVDQIGQSSKSYLGVPILAADEVIGVLSVQSTQQENRFKEDDLRLLNTIAANVGIAMHNAELFDEAQQARAQAEEANEAKSSFLSTISHELRTPLTSVIGFAKIIRKRLEEKIFPLLQTADSKVLRSIEQVSDNLKVVISEGERLTTLINDVLDLAKIESGRVEWKMEEVSIEALIDRAKAVTSTLFVEKNLSLELDVQAGLPTVRADHDRMLQVLINLLSNAVKFTNQGTVSIKAKQESSHLVVSITDSGIGIAPEDQAKVFEKFKQAGDTLTDKPKGTGLGLPICKEIVEHHGGQLWLESELGKGSTFYFSLPLQTSGIKPLDLERLMQQLREQVSASGSTKRNGSAEILVVDDEPHIRNLLRQELTEAGYRVREASNGREAIELTRKEHPDLIILDVMMPEMNGFDVAAVLKNDPKTLDIPILILSIVQDQERGYRLGIDRYLTKPIDTEKLFAEVSTLIGQGKSQKKVMVVDENSSTVKTLADVLQERGYQVVESNGEEFLEKALSNRPDIIILSSKLGEQQEVVRTLRFERGLENVLFLVYE